MREGGDGAAANFPAPMERHGGLAMAARYRKIETLDGWHYAAS